MDEELVQQLDQQGQDALDGFEMEFAPENLDQSTLERRLDEEAVDVRKAEGKMIAAEKRNKQESYDGEKIN